MFDPKSSNVDKIESMVIEAMDNTTQIDKKYIRSMCDLALRIVWSSADPCPDTLAFQLVMPVALFLSQVQVVKENRPSTVQDTPLSEAISQAICMEIGALKDHDIVPHVVEATFKKIAEMGYSINRTHEITLEEAESVGCKC